MSETYSEDPSNVPSSTDNVLAHSHQVSGITFMFMKLTLGESHHSSSPNGMLKPLHQKCVFLSDLLNCFVCCQKACLEDVDRRHRDIEKFRISHILDLSTATASTTNSYKVPCSQPIAVPRSLSESEASTNLSTSPSIRVTPPTPRSKSILYRHDSFDSCGSLPRPDSRQLHCDSRNAWQQLNDDLNQIFPKRCCMHENQLRRTSLKSFPSKKCLDEYEHESDVYHTVYGGRNNPLTASRGLGPFSKIVRRQVSTSDGMLEVSEKNSSSSSLTSLNDQSCSYITFAVSDMTCTFHVRVT